MTESKNRAVIGPKQLVQIAKHVVLPMGAVYVLKNIGKIREKPMELATVGFMDALAITLLGLGIISGEENIVIVNSLLGYGLMNAISSAFGYYTLGPGVEDHSK